MRRILTLMLLGTILLGVTAPALAGPPRVPPTQGGTVSGSFGDPNDMYLEYTISGADFQLVEGYNNRYQGLWNGGPVHFSGKMIVSRAEGFTSQVTMSASAPGIDRAQTVRWPAEGEDNSVSGRTVELPFDLTWDVPPDYNYEWGSGSAKVEACGGFCGDYTVSWEVLFPTPAPTEEAPAAEPTAEPAVEPSPTVERNVTIRGTVSAVDPSAGGGGGAIRPIVEAPVLLFRGGEEWTRTLSRPPDGSYEFIVPQTADLAVGVFLEHGLSSPAAFQIVYDQAADPIWVATYPFDVDETTPDVLLKDLNLSTPDQLYSGPTQVPADRLDDVGLAYYYAREAWQMATILLGMVFDLPTVKIRAFSTKPDIVDSAGWVGPITNLDYTDPVIDISPKYSNYDKAGGGDTVLHELGHHIMADAYSNELPGVVGEKNHGGFANKTTTDSWVEGFASFYALWTKRDEIQGPDPQFWWDRGTPDNMEPNDLAWDRLEEEAVTGLLWDLLDPIDPKDATAMPVADPASAGGATPNQTLYGDHVQVDSSDLWNYLTNMSLAAVDSPRAAPQGYPHIFDVKQLYDTLQMNGVGLTVAATPNGLDAVDELFIAHGFFADVAPQNRAWDVGEEIGVTANLSMTVGTASYPERLTRRSPPPNDSFIAFNAVDASGAAVAGVTDFMIEVRFEPPFELYNYEVPARAWDDSTLYYAPPPPHYATTTTIRPSGSGVASASALTFTSQEYWQWREANPTGSFVSHTFEVEPVGEGLGQDDLPVDLGFDDLSGVEGLSGVAGPAVVALCCGGLFLVLLIIMGVVVSSRRRKRRQQAEGEAFAPGVGQPLPPASPPPPAGGWQLAVIQGPETGHRFGLGRQATIGRSQQNDISLDDGQASRRHAQVWQTPGGYAVQDMGSTNGTFVNGVRIQQAVPLNAGDRLQVGDTVFQVMGPQGQAGGAGMTCPHCGYSVEPGMRFCGQCGGLLG